MYYCVNAEFYDNGEVLACITSSKRMGRHQSRGVPGMHAFKIWFISKTVASAFESDCKAHRIDLEDAMQFYSEMKNIERERLLNGSKRGVA
jgi:hypothetical protein